MKMITLALALSISFTSFAQSSSYETYRSNCETKNFESTYLNFLGSENEIRGIIYNPNVSCEDAKSVDNLISDVLNYFPDQKRLKPDLFLVHQSDNARASLDLHAAINIMKEEQLSFNPYTNALLVHEYGHLLFTWNMSERNEDLGSLYKLQQITKKTDIQIHYIMKLIRENLPIVEAEKTVEIYSKEAEDIVIELALDLDRIMLLDEIQLPFNEFYADVISVSFFKDPSIMTKGVSVLAHNPASFTVTGRDFANPGNRFEVFQDWDKMNYHTALAPARYELYKLTFAKNNFSPVIASKLLEVISKSISELLVSGTEPFSLQEQTKEEKVASLRFLNEICIKNLRAALGN